MWWQIGNTELSELWTFPFAHANSSQEIPSGQMTQNMSMLGWHLGPRVEGWENGWGVWNGRQIVEGASGEKGYTTTTLMVATLLFYWCLSGRTQFQRAQYKVQHMTVRMVKDHNGALTTHVDEVISVPKLNGTCFWTVARVNGLIWWIMGEYTCFQGG